MNPVLLFLIIAFQLQAKVLLLPEQGKISFSYPNGIYTPEKFEKDFGQTIAATKLLDIESNSLRITYPKGEKLKGLKAALTIPPANSYTLLYRICYAMDFEEGMHGKQLGLMGGMAYTGGKGQEARTKGDGWSVRIQFDAEKEFIRNRLYVYHAGMKGIYGESLGTNQTPFRFPRNEWQVVALRVTMQSHVSKSDGRIEVWLNSMKKMDVQNVKFVTKEAGRLVDKITLSAFSGGGGITATRDNFVYLDDLSWVVEK